MLMLLFQAGNHRYAINTQQVGEVLPWASLCPATGGQAAIVGLLNYHCNLVSVIDLGLLIHQIPSRPHYGSRIILVSAAAIPGFETAKWLGLLADRVVDTQSISPDRLSPMDESSAPYLGRAIIQDQTIIRCFHPEGLDLRPAALNPLVVPAHAASVS
jgi:chemotaxis-related protein WspB